MDAQFPEAFGREAPQEIVESVLADRIAQSRACLDHANEEIDDRIECRRARRLTGGRREYPVAPGKVRGECGRGPAAAGDDVGPIESRLDDGYVDSQRADLVPKCF
jgi:hypothetical protein